MPDPGGASPVDLSKRWTQHLREHANTTVSYACPNCADRKIQQSEDELWKHTISNHGALLPASTDRAAIQEFRRNLRIRASEKGCALISRLPKSSRNAFTPTDHLSRPVKLPLSAAAKTPHGTTKSFTPGPEDGMIRLNTYGNQSKRPFSPTQTMQGSEISGLKDLNIATDHDSLMEDPAEANELEPQPKRPAIGEGESPSTSSRARDSQSPPKRSKAPRPNSAPYNKKVDSFDYKRDSKAMAGPAHHQSTRPAPAGRRIWNPETDALPKQSVESPANRVPKGNPNNLARRDRRPHQSTGQNLPHCSFVSY